MGEYVAVDLQNSECVRTDKESPIIFLRIVPHVPCHEFCESATASSGKMMTKRSIFLGFNSVVDAHK